MISVLLANQRRSQEEDPLKKEKDSLPSVENPAVEVSLASPTKKKKRLQPPNPWLERSAWEATGEGEFYDLLTTQQDLWQDPAFVLDGKWWHHLDDKYGEWLTTERLENTFHDMALWALTPGKYPPKHAGSWKTFIANWLKKDYETDRRNSYINRRPSYATP